LSYFGSLKPSRFHAYCDREKQIFIYNSLAVIFGSYFSHFLNIERIASKAILIHIIKNVIAANTPAVIQIGLKTNQHE
jgi:hypothetical protein